MRSVPVGTGISFDGSTSTDVDGSLVDYSWDLDGDGEADATGPAVSTEYPNAGERFVLLTVTDDGGASDTAAFRVMVTDPSNPPPVAVDDAATTAEDTPVTIDVLANDTDEGSDITELGATQLPSHGTVYTSGDSEEEPGAFVYVPEADYHGTDSFEYAVCDSQEACDVALVTIDVAAVNDAPRPKVRVSRTEGTTPLTVTFDATESSDPDGAITGYEWDFDGDGVVDSRAGATVAYTYTLARSY